MIIPSAVKRVEVVTVQIQLDGTRVTTADASSPYRVNKTVFNYLGMNIQGADHDDPVYAGLSVRLYPSALVSNGMTTGVGVVVNGASSSTPGLAAEVHFQVIEYA